MINGFEKETHELSEKDMILLPTVVKGLKSKVGYSKAVTCSKIIDGINLLGHKIDGARVRKIIHYIRVNSLIENLISTNKGYYIATSKEEINSYIQGLDQRISSITQIRNSFLTTSDL